ncbi:retrovirus-related pol polyprotein from transposon TNT 1-94 [Tanacetum coccineum]
MAGNAPGKRVAYLVVANYVRNTWGTYGLVRSMFSSSTGLFSFQFSSIKGLDAMLENGLWFIRNNLLILKKWNPDENLLKEEYRSVLKKPNASSSGNKKKGVEPTIEVSNSNPFDVLNSVDNDVKFGTNGGTTNFGKLRLLDNDENSLVPTGIVKSDSEVEVAFDENRVFLCLLSQL